jgi:putative ABC transport system permease protein
MTLTQIAFNNLRRRLAKTILMLSGLAIGIATTVSLYSIVDSMQTRMDSQLAAYGASIVITGDVGEISFSYGGISIPEVLFDVEQLNQQDVDKIGSLPDASMVRSIIPKLWGRLQANGQEVTVVGSDLRSDFAIKPWLRIRDLLNKQPTQPVTSNSGMAGDSLDLSRQNFENLNLQRNEIILGANVAYNLGLFPGSSLVLSGQEFRVAAILQKNGSAEDNQILMDIAVARNLLQKPDEVSLIEISVDHHLGSEERLLAQLESSLPNARITSLRKAMFDRDELITRLVRFGSAISIIVLIAGLLVASLTMAGSVRSRTREIGIFRAIGYRSVHIAQIILTEGITVSVLGGIVGYLTGMLIAFATGPLLAGFDLAVIWRPSLLLYAVLLSVAIGSLASLWPTWRAIRIDPVQALRDI